MMLASKGVDLTQLSQKLDTLSTRKTFEPLEPVPEADISSYLKNEVENVLLSLIEETHSRVSFCRQFCNTEDSSNFKSKSISYVVISTVI